MSIDFDFSGLKESIELFIEGEEYSDNKEDIKDVISRYEDGTKCEGKFEGTSLGSKGEFGYRWVCLDDDGKVGIKMRSKKEDDETQYARFTFYNDSGDPEDNERLEDVRDLTEEFDAKIVGEEEDSDDKFGIADDVMFDVSDLPDEADGFMDKMTDLGFDAKDVVYGMFTYEQMNIGSDEVDRHDFFGKLYVGADIETDDLEGFGGSEAFYNRIRKFVEDLDDRIFH